MNIDVAPSVQFGVDFEKGTVGTIFFNEGGKVMGTSYGTRPATDENVKEAWDQGYDHYCCEKVCLDSLIDHELLHTIIWRELYKVDSGVLLHEAEIKPCPYVARLWEETLVLSAQHYLNKKQFPVPEVSGFLFWVMPAIEAKLKEIRSRLRQGYGGEKAA